MKDYLSLMQEYAPWLTGLYQNNMEDTVVWDFNKETKTFEKKEKLIAEIVNKSGIKRSIIGYPLYKTKVDVLTISSKTKNITLDLLKDEISFGDIDTVLDHFN